MFTIKMITVALVQLALVGLAARAEIVENPIDELDVGSIQDAIALRDQFDRINEQLANQLHSDRFDVYIEAAIERRATEVSSFMKDALSLLISLPDAVKLCNKEGYQILAKSYIASNYRSHKLGRGITKESSGRLIERLVYHYAEQHAQNCRPTYAEQFKRRLAFGLGAEPKRIVSSVFEGLELSDLTASDEVKSVAALDINSMDIRRAAIDKILDHLVALVGEQNRSDNLRTVAKFESQIYDKYLLDSCEQYYNQMTDVFAPAKFDAMIEDSEQRELLHSSDDEFKNGWTNYKVCLFLLRTESFWLFEPAIEARAKNYALL